MSVISPKKSSVGGKIPVPQDLQVGEIAVNLIDRVIYAKDGTGTVITLGATPTEMAAKASMTWVQSYAEPAFVAGAVGQYFRGDKTWQTLNKAAVGLSLVDNTSDAAKPISDATATALANKEAVITTGLVNQYFKGGKTWADFDSAVRSALMSGLSLAVSTAVTAADSLITAVGKLQVQINLMMPKSGGIFTGNVTGKVIGFTEFDVGVSAGSKIVDFATNGQKQKITLTATTPTLTISAPTLAGHYQLRIVQDATGGRVPTFSGLSSTRWLGTATAPAVNAAANGETILNLYWDGTQFTQSMSKVGA
jgi:hypothetical protein